VLATRSEGFSKLLDIMHWVGLTGEFFSITNNVTVFAPTDAAFAQLPPGFLDNLNATGQLGAFLMSLVYPGYLPTSAMTDNQMISMVNSTSPVRVNVYSTGLFLNGLAQVIVRDVPASNGLIQITNSVIMSPSTAETPLAALVSQGNFTQLVKVLTAVGLDRFLGDNVYNPSYTLIAPNDLAFSKLPSGALDNLLQINNNSVYGLLRYHILDGTVFTTAFPPGDTTYHTLDGNNTFVASYDAAANTIILKDQNNGNSNVVVRNIQAKNGVIHEVDSLITPQGFAFPTPSPDDKNLPAIIGGAVGGVIGLIIIIAIIVYCCRRHRPGYERVAS